MVIPFAASTDTVKSVPNFSSFLGTIRLSPNFSARACETGAQIRPRPSRAIKLINAGVTLLAANTRSPSFSLCASSVIITIRPFLMAATTSSMRSAPYDFFILHLPRPFLPTSPLTPKLCQYLSYPLPIPVPYRGDPHLFLPPRVPHFE